MLGFLRGLPLSELAGPTESRSQRITRPISKIRENAIISYAISSVKFIEKWLGFLHNTMSS